MVSNKDVAGERAFPCGEMTGVEPGFGMTLRDYFAAAALPIVAPAHSVPHANVTWIAAENFPVLAADAYRLADAMLKARQP